MGEHKSLAVTRFLQWTLLMKALHIDNYNVPLLGIELCERLHLIGLDCAGYEKSSAIYKK